MIRVTAPPGMGKRIGLGMAKSGIFRLYQDLKGGPGSFRNDLEERIRQYQVYDPRTKKKVTLQELASTRGLERELDQYINSTFKGMRKRLAHTLDMVTSMKDSLEDVVEGTELISVVGQAGNVVELPVALVAQTMYSGLAGALGLASGVYRPTPGGVFKYMSDTAKGYGGVVVNAIPFLGSFVELATNLDDKRPRIADAFARRIGKKLVKDVKDNVHTIADADLESKVKSSSGKTGFFSKGSSSSSGPVDYNSRVSSPGQAYAGDFAQANRFYQTVNQ